MRTVAQTVLRKAGLLEDEDKFSYRYWKHKRNESGLSLFLRRVCRKTAQSVFGSRWYGGHKAGEFASRYVVEHIVRSIKGSKEEEAVGILSESIETANRKLKEYADAHQQMRGMGTTIVAAVIQGRTLLVANVGDSRLYIVGDEITQVTQDHSLVQEMVRLGQMDPQSAKNHPDKNIITRAVGVSEKVKIDIFERQLRAGEYIILCSDGLTNMVEDSVILQILHGAGSLSDKAERLIELANKNGGKDNITVIIIEPNSDEVAEC